MSITVLIEDTVYQAEIVGERVHVWAGSEDDTFQIGNFLLRDNQLIEVFPMSQTEVVIGVVINE